MDEVLYWIEFLRYSPFLIPSVLKLLYASSPRVSTNCYSLLPKFFVKSSKEIVLISFFSPWLVLVSFVEHPLNTRPEARKIAPIFLKFFIIIYATTCRFPPLVCPINIINRFIKNVNIQDKYNTGILLLCYNIEDNV